MNPKINVVKAKRKKGMKDNKDYISGGEMLIELQICQESGKISDKLAKMFILLCKNLANHRYFVRYSYRDEFIQSGILACVLGFPKFDPKKSDNPFGYFTQVGYRAFRQFQIKEKKHQDTRDLLLIESNVSPSYNFGDNDDRGDE